MLNRTDPIRRTRNAHTVSEINKYVKEMFLNDYLLKQISVKGEVSNCKYHPTGHIYFSLKDAGGTLSCVMFAGSRKGLSFRMEDGQQVIVTGSVDVYERDGKYQLYARQIEQDGLGSLYERYLLLKEELEQMGMFDRSYKKPIPTHANRIGIVTAPTGAAIRDIQNIAYRRNPFVQLILCPALVQGEGAAASICRGIRRLEQTQVDVIIVGRGGGSIEDLWAFNERIVAETIFSCSVPVISAVGHETDTTISDHVADLRAPTPSAAAELAVWEYTAFQDTLLSAKRRLDYDLRAQIMKSRQRLTVLEKEVQKNSPQNHLNEMKYQQVDYADRLRGSMERKLTASQHAMCVYMERLEGLSPLKKLQSGYSYTQTSDGRALKSVHQTGVGEHITVHVTDGEIEAVVEQIRKEEE